MAGKLKILGLALMALALSLTGPDAHGHRIKHIFTTVELSAENRLEVVHQVHLHDASFALSLLQNMRETDVLDLEGQARMLLHLKDQFSVSSEGDPIPLEVVGAEIEGNHLYLYFESAEIETPRSLAVANSMLMDLFTDQQNLMNLSVGGVLKSLRFQKPDEIKIARFD